MQIKIVSSTLLAIGSVLIFSSWIAQNYFEQEWESEYQRRGVGSDQANNLKLQ